MKRPMVLLVIVAIALVAIGLWVLERDDMPASSVQSLTSPATTEDTVSATEQGPTALVAEPASTTSSDAIELLPPDAPLPEKGTTSTSHSVASGESPPTTAPTATSRAETYTGEENPGVSEKISSDTVLSVDSDGSSADKAESPGEGQEEPAHISDQPVDSPRSSKGPTYSWQDGDRTLEATLQPDLTVREDGATLPSDEVIADTGAGSVVRGQQGSSESTQSDGLPVFRSDSGALMTLPGGVLLALDPEWSQTDTDAFFATNQITLDQVSELEWLPNGFFIETEPGFPSLELANALAGQDGVVFSSPNWWTERATK